MTHAHAEDQPLDREAAEKALAELAGQINAGQSGQPEKSVDEVLQRLTLLPVDVMPNLSSMIISNVGAICSVLLSLNFCMLCWLCMVEVPHVEVPKLTIIFKSAGCHGLCPGGE